MHNSRTRGFAVVLLLGLLPGGCRSYEPRPLEPNVHRQQWRERSPSSASVMTLVERLAIEGSPSSDAEPSAYDPSDGVSLAEAELIALVFNPELRLARLRAGVASASAEHAGLWDDPELSIDVLRITESVSNPWVVTPGLAFTIPISGRLEVEKSRADAQLRAELLRVAEEEWRVRHEVRQAWLQWSAAVLRAEETRSLIGSMGGLADSTARLARAGEMPRTEAALFVIERIQRQQELGRLEGASAVGQQRLRMLMGLSPEAPLELEPTFDLGPLAAAEGADAVERSLRVQRACEEYQVAEHALHREIRKQYPDLTIGPLYESDQGQSRIGLIGGIPLPILNANRQGIAEATAERELARAAFETEIERLEGSLAVARVLADALQAQYDDLVTDVAPMVDRQVDDALQLLQLGEGGGLVLLESLIRSHDTKLDILDLRRDRALASAELAFLLGPERHRETPDTTTPATGVTEGEVDR